MLDIEEINLLRIHYGINNTQLAKRVGITRPYLIFLEQRRKGDTPSKDYVLTEELHDRLIKAIYEIVQEKSV